MNDLVKPASVIVTHVNEIGTIGGKLNPQITHRGVHQSGEAAGASGDQRAHHGV